MTFVNAHLAAFDEACDRRNADFHDLSKRLLFDSGVPAREHEDQDGYSSPPTVPLNIYQSDALFWLGGMCCSRLLQAPALMIFVSMRRPQL